MTSIIHKSIKATKTLIELGANIAITDASGRTALMLACIVGNQEIVEELLNAGADVNMQTPLGDTCFSYAQRYGFHEIALVLRQKGKPLKAPANLNAIRCKQHPYSKASEATKAKVI